ncbi:MAG: hypothetical protein R3B90_20235 [Planctomycetaceae bacterium]
MNCPSRAAQFAALRRSAVLVDLTDREQLQLLGADRATFLHNFCTQEIKRLPIGSGAEAFITNIKGRIVGHVLVFAGADALWLDTPADTAAALVAHLDRYIITEDVTIENWSERWGEFAVVGSGAAEVVERLLPGSGAFAPFQHGSDGVVAVRRFSFTDDPGWLVGRGT